MSWEKLIKWDVYERWVVLDPEGRLDKVLWKREHLLWKNRDGAVIEYTFSNHAIGVDFSLLLKEVPFFVSERVDRVIVDFPTITRAVLHPKDRFLVYTIQRAHSAVYGEMVYDTILNEKIRNHSLEELFNGKRLAELVFNDMLTLRLQAGRIRRVWKQVCEHLDPLKEVLGSGWYTDRYEVRIPFLSGVYAEVKRRVRGVAPFRG